MPCLPQGTGPVNARATQTVASLRIAARQALGDQLLLGTSLGPAMFRLGDAEYHAAYPGNNPLAVCPSDCGTVYYLAHRTVYGVAAGLSLSYRFSGRFRLGAQADDAVLRARPAAPSSSGGWTSVMTPLQHEVTFSAMAALTLR